MAKQSYLSRAVCIGVFAKQLLTHPDQGRVMGITSGGLFVKLAENRILFITSDASSGPVTIHVDKLQMEKNAIVHGQLVEYSIELLVIPALHLSVDLRQAELWLPPPRPKRKKTNEERNSHLLTIIHKLMNSGRQSTYLTLLAEIINPGNDILQIDREIAAQVLPLPELQDAILANDPELAGNILKGFLGNGPGLTPAGDDFVCGFLLALNRWQDILCPQFTIQTLNEKMAKEAEKLTSSLSLTLIEAATHGWGDDHMMMVLDSVFVVGFDAKQCVDTILTYGSSSGMDMFAGIVVGVMV